MGQELVFQARRGDFRIERMRGSGPGGQHRNRTESCVRITHRESGLQEYCCEERSQHSNLRTAFRRLARRVVDHYMRQEQRQRYSAGHRRVRTYSEADDRVTCHLSGEKFSWRATAGKGDLGPLVLAAHRGSGDATA